MIMAGIRTELLKVLTNGKTDERRRKYFYWKHGLNTLTTDYANMTEEEFIEWACESPNQYEYLKRWEQSDEYKRLEYIYRSEQFEQDLLDVYEATKKAAMEGNSSAVKTLLELQKEIKKRIKEYNRDTEEQDDGLKLDV